MVSSRMLSIFFCLHTFINISLATEKYNRFICDRIRGNYADDSTYATNLNIVLSSLSSNTQIDYGFYNFSHGQNSDKVYAIGLCEVDVKPERCRTCLQSSGTLLTQRCTVQKEAISWADYCMLRYSNRSIFGQMETQPSFAMRNIVNATNWSLFNKSLETLLDRLKIKAASGDSRRKFAVEDIRSPGVQTIYGLAHCTPDLSEKQCSECLDNNFKYMAQYCNVSRGCRGMVPSCFARYEIYRFVINVTADAAPRPSSTNTTIFKEGKKKRPLTMIVVPVVVTIVLLILVYLYIKIKMARKHISNEVEVESGSDIEITVDSLIFDFEIIRLATNDFSDANKLGQGGFGAVYKGKLYDGKEIAVKRLSRNSDQGDIEFKNEVLLVAKLQHRNLVRLLGFCLEGVERLLVYEFVPNRSLDYFLFDPIKCAQLNWSKRYEIIRGIARGLLYLHDESQLKIIHRGLKASNILLDKDLIPKIADFGLARLFVGDQMQGTTSNIVGTYGYMAPEYAMHGHFSVKSDVFSFGVLILEIVTGLKNNDIGDEENFDDLLTNAWKNWREGTISNIIDSTLDNSSSNEIIRCIHIGLLCVQENVANRPTMATTVLMLSSTSATLQIPSEPTFSMHSSSDVLAWAHDSRETGSSKSKSTSLQESAEETSTAEKMN